VQLALDRPGAATVLTQWTPQPVGIALVVILGLAYWHGVRRLDRPWSRGRALVFTVGLVGLAWATCGFPQVYGDSVYWVWTSQTLGIWLGLPLLLLAGQPVQLARAVSGPDGIVERALRSRFTRIFGNPLVGPALVPALSAGLFFGPLPGWAIAWPVVGWLLQVALLVIGAVMVVPLVGLDEGSSSLAVGLSLAIGCFELVLDAVPGIVLRLHKGLATSWFDHRSVHAWSFGALHDQQIAGGILWCIAEVIDWPFLWLAYRRWLRADARDAARVDAVLAAERAARRALDEPDGADGVDGADAPDRPPVVERDAPWWESDPAMQQRLRRRR
jgi:putative membrane protein